MNIDVVYYPCNIRGCNYEAKTAGSVKLHKAHFHDINVLYYPCVVAGCNYEAKRHADLRSHKGNVHYIDVQYTKVTNEYYAGAIILRRLFLVCI